jgi:hypothetical protein
LRKGFGNTFGISKAIVKEAFVKYTVDSQENFEINFAPSSVVDEVLQNIAMILSTVKGTVPLDRGFGISDRFVDRPVTAAQALIRADIYEAIERYESRAQIVDIIIDYNISGSLTIKTEVKINE